MKKILGLFLSVFITGTAFAQTVAQDLVGLGMPPEQADYLAGILPAGSVAANDTWIKGRNAANSADINMLKIDTSDNTVINSSASDDLIFQLEDDANRLIFFDASSDAAMNIKWGDGGTTAAAGLNIFASTSDADDDYALAIGGGGAIDTLRGGYFVISGNEEASTGGSIVGQLGNVSTANYDLRMENPSSAVRIRDTTSGGLWEFQNDGDLASDATNGGDIIFQKAASGIREVTTSAITPGALTGGAFATPANGGILSAGLNVVPTAIATTANFVALPLATANVGKTATLVNVTGLGVNVAAEVGNRLNAGAALTPHACTTGQTCSYVAVSTTEWAGK